MIHKTEIDLVLPCYNPPPGWEQKVSSKFNALQSLFDSIHFHLFIVSDGSKRGYEPKTIHALEEAIPGITIVNYSQNRGKGYALREAVKHCKSMYIIYTDYDFPYTDESFRRVIDTLLNGADVVVAIRDKSYQKGLPPFRKFLSESSHLCNAYLLRLKIRDTQGGLKGFNRKGQNVFLTTKVNSFLFDTEFIFKAQKEHLNIQAIQSRIREGLHVSDMGFNVLKRETANFLSILFNK